MPYDERLIAPMREEVTRLGVKELKTVADVDAALGDPEGTQLVFVNSVCGCAAGGARPALALALEHSVRPTELYSVFAGQDLEAKPDCDRFGPGPCLRRALRRPEMSSGMVFHPGHEELHGVTVLVRDTGARLWIGRYHERAERGVVMRDVAVFNPESGDSPASWVAKQLKFGVRVEHRVLVIPEASAVSITRLTEVELGSL